MTTKRKRFDEARLNEVLPLLQKLDTGDEITDKEYTWLSSLQRIIQPSSDLAYASNNNSKFTDSHLQQLVKLSPNLTWLDLDYTNVSDLSPLKELPELRQLDLRSTKIKDLSPLSQLVKLQQLILVATEITDLSPLERLTELKTLSLASTTINDLTKLSKLLKLKQLNLSSTAVSNLDPLMCLEKLIFLNLNSTQVCNLTPLEGLKKLKQLDLAFTQVNDLTSLVEANKLIYLDLSSSKVRDLTPITHLSELQTLYLDNTPVKDFTSLNKLINLETLSLSNTSISDLSPLAELVKIKCLLLDSTRVTDLTPINRLVSLKQLNLNDLKLDTIPRFCVRDGLRLSLTNTIISRQPKALFQLPTKQILNTYYDVPHVKINEGKVIFLGDPGVGKTSTIQRIRSGGIKQTFDTKSTPGVDIQPFNYGDNTQIRFWDFGGQEILQSMHNCFLTERTCYVVVVNNRRENSDSQMVQARKWLRTIAGFSQHVSVLLFVNQWNNVAPDNVIFDEELKTICPALSDIVFYSAMDDTQEQFNRRVTDKICQEVSHLDSVKLELPDSWANIRTDMLLMAEPYVTMADFRLICGKHGLGGHDKHSEAIRIWLLEWFNDMGICFSYHKNAPIKAKMLNSYKVLQPKWLTEGIYRIIYNGGRCTASGFVNHDDIRSMLLLDNESFLAVDKTFIFAENDFYYILEVMRKFGRSFDHGDGREFIPETLSDHKPENCEPRELGFDAPVTYTLKLTHLPLGLLHHLMITLFSYCDGLIWKRGIRLRDDNNVLLIESEVEKPMLHFRLFRHKDHKWYYFHLFHQARQFVQTYILEHRLVLEDETIRIERDKSAASYSLNTILQAWNSNIETQLPFNEGPFGFVPVTDFLLPLFPIEVLYATSQFTRFDHSTFVEACTALANVYPYNTSDTMTALLYKYKNSQIGWRDSVFDDFRDIFTSNPTTWMLAILGKTWLNDIAFSKWLKKNGTLSPKLQTELTKKKEVTNNLWDRKEIRGINQNIIQWAISSPLYKMAIGNVDLDYEKLSLALGQNDDKRYESSFFLMLAIWQNHPELGLAPDYKLLSEKEYGGEYYSRYRDHTTHMFKVFLLGLYLYEKSETIRRSIEAKDFTETDFLNVWILTALYHDIGYIIETEDGCWDSNSGKGVILRFNEHLAHPMSCLYPDVMDHGTEEAIQTEAHVSIRKADGQFSIRNKIDCFRGIGPIVKLSPETNSNPVEGYYEYASSKHIGRIFYDHGIVSACILLYACDATCDYMYELKNKRVSLYTNQEEKLNKFLDFSEKYKGFAKTAAQAIGLHNIQKNWDETEIKNMKLLYGVTISSFCIPQQDLPIAYLLRVCDELQCWDRRSFVSPLGQIRTSLEQDKLSFIPRLGEVDISVKDREKRDELEKALSGVLYPPLTTFLELKD